MKFTVDRDSLHTALQNVVRIVPPKSPIPILSNILISAADDKIKLAASDIELSIVTIISGEVAEPGKNTIPAAQLSELVLRLGPGKISIEDKEGRISISSNTGNYHLMGMQPDDFPSIQSDIKGVTVENGFEGLGRMIEKTVFAASKDRTRMALTGVLCRVEPEKITMVATDGHRLARIIKNVSSGTKELCDSILPPKSLESVRRLISQEDGLKSLTFAENHVLFDFGQTSVLTRVIEGPYPNYEQVIPLSNTKSMQVNSEALLQAVQRVSVLSSATTHQIVFSLSEDTLELFSSSQELGGEARETLAVSYQGEPLKVGYNALYLAEILAKMNTGDVKIELDTSETAGVISPCDTETSEEYICLIMPLLLDEQY